MTARKEPPRGTPDKVRRWAADGTPRKVMARRLGVSASTLTRWIDEVPRVSAAYDEGVEDEHQRLLESLRSHLKSGPTAAIFLLKTRHGYVEGDRTGQANQVQVTFNLPGAAPKDEWAKVIDAKPVPAKAIKHVRS
ncbi:MAG: hypothetical protein ACTHXB_07210 [Luteimonas sp.]